MFPFSRAIETESVVEVEIEEADNRLRKGVQAAGSRDLEGAIDFRPERRAKTTVSAIRLPSRSAWQDLDHPIFHGQPGISLKIGDIVRDQNEPLAIAWAAIIPS